MRQQFGGSNLKGVGVEIIPPYEDKEKHAHQSERAGTQARIYVMYMGGLIVCQQRVLGSWSWRRHNNSPIT
jgi:hypothetical protein